MIATLHLQYSQSLPWVILLIAGLSIATLLAYTAQLRGVPRCWRWIPPTLRILAISAISLSILRPAVVRTRLASERAPIAVLIDNSRSMSAVDTNRSPGEWVGIAAAMGRLPANARDKNVAAFQADCDRLNSQVDDVARARAELGYATLSGRGIDAALSRLDKVIDDFQSTARDVRSKLPGVSPLNQLETNLAYLVRIPVRIDRERWLNDIGKRAANVAQDAETARFASDKRLYVSDPAIRDACEPLQLMSRLQMGESTVFDPDGLRARLGADTRVQFFTIGDAVTSIAKNSHPLLADGNSSNLNGGIRLVLESMKASPPRAVVLISDGRQVAADYDAATMVAVQGVPIFTVYTAPAHYTLADLSIVNANVTGNAIVGEKITFEVSVRARGLPRNTVTRITFEGGGEEHVQEARFPDERPITVFFTMTATQPGLQKLTVDVAGVPGEASLENNHIERWVNVTAATTRPAGRPATKPAVEAEMTDLSGDEGALLRLSTVSGGQFFRLDQVELLPRRLATLRDDVNHPIDVPLWDGSYVFVFVLGCLAAEWGVRKRWGLS